MSSAALESRSQPTLPDAVSPMIRPLGLRRVSLDETIPVNVYRSFPVHVIPAFPSPPPPCHRTSLPTILSTNDEVAPSLQTNSAPALKRPSLSSTSSSSLYSDTSGIASQSFASSSQQLSRSATHSPDLQYPHALDLSTSVGYRAPPPPAPSYRADAHTFTQRHEDEWKRHALPSLPMVVSQPNTHATDAPAHLPSIYSLLFDNEPATPTLPPLSRMEGLEPVHHPCHTLRPPSAADRNLRAEQLASNFHSDTTPSGLPSLDDSQRLHFYGSLAEHRRPALPVAFRTRYEDIVALERRVRTLYEENSGHEKSSAQSSDLPDDSFSEQYSGEADKENEPPVPVLLSALERCYAELSDEARVIERGAPSPHSSDQAQSATASAVLPAPPPVSDARRLEVGTSRG
ncbi:hypothetical protein BV25DRAFT_1830277 [Artomyces pyxidatus]|uniref:Uncharacterized protein n=1 Tax=Artomyces pyxidatus TaxID=48021 RepID=A0ACB8SPA1_9AGAM|nr:hypothetical protein BV25DRAFT_1830277 [Artomyces pyxidatus]